MISSEAQEGLVELYCREIKLPGLRRSFRATVREAENAGQPYLSFLLACLAQEAESRRHRALENRLRQARFPWVKNLSDFDFRLLPSLAKPKVLALGEGTFIKARENVVCIGPTGTGKSHIAIAVGVNALQSGYRVRFVSAMQLSQELLQAQAEVRLPKVLRAYDRFDLVIIDELGYLGLGPGGPLLFQFCAHRYERGSVVLTTNLEFSRWAEVFGDPTLTSALLDRLTHRSHILLFNGESYRFRESQRRLKEEDRAT